MVLKVFFVISFCLVFLPTILASLLPGVMLLIVPHREIALPISKKHPKKAHRSESGLKLCIHERATYALRHLHAVRKQRAVNELSTNLRRANDTRCMERTPGASSFLRVRAKNWQILVLGKCYVNRLRMAQCRFAVPSTHTCIWFTSSSRTIWRARVYEAL